MLIGELLNRTRLEKLLRDSYGNYCVQVRLFVAMVYLCSPGVQTALDYAEPNQRALLVEGIRPVLPLIRNTPYGKRIQNKLQREQLDGPGFGGTYPGQPSVANLALRNPNLGMGGLVNDGYGNPYGLQGGMQGQGSLSQNHMQMPTIDSYVLQNGSSHSPGLTPPHTHAGFSAGATYGTAFPAMTVNDPYQRGYGYGM